MKECFVEKRFGAESLRLIQYAESICTDYARQGYDLTLRQLYYQFVARGIIQNKDTEYKRLGSIVNDARLAGKIDWNHITDRTRNLAANSHWDDPGGIIDSAAHSYAIDKWEGQEHRVEIWVEKEALAGVVARAARALDCAYFSCRGYVSQSEMWGAGKRLARYIEAGQKPVILHLGDHDPSGIDMTRDIQQRLWMFACQSSDFQQLCDGVKEEWGTDQDVWSLERADLEDVWGRWCSEENAPDVTVKRIALNMDQVRAYNPPPNPAKITDSRCDAYIRKYGNESWELDALDPATINALITSEVGGYLDLDLYNTRKAQEEQEREALTACSKQWTEVCGFLGGEQ